MAVPSVKRVNSFGGNLEHNTTVRSGASPKWKRMNSEGSQLPLNFNTNGQQREYDPQDITEVLELFNKKYSFTGLWELPSESSMFLEDKWKLDDFLTKKVELNNVKNKLNDLNLEDWHKHTNMMNKAGNIVWMLKKEVQPEFLTQAWCKFYEICGSYEFVCEEAQESFVLNSVHLCEAPGAFIASLNHYLQLNHPDIKWSWISTTLNPYYEENPLSNMINDDRFILHTLDKWRFGHDYKGDLTDIENLKYLAGEARQLGPVLMVTADGGMDCQNNPGEQEGIVSQIVFCETVCALHLLSPGGSFVVKMFTMYEVDSICLMYLLVCCFAQVNVFKPATSKEGNSENYVVCLNYKGVDVLKPWLRKLRTQYSAETTVKAMFPLTSIPLAFLAQLRACVDTFKNYQVDAIERNLVLFESTDAEVSYRKVKRIRYMVAEEYINRFGLKPLRGLGQPIIDPETLRRTEKPNIDPRLDEGTFNERLAREGAAPLDKLDYYLRDVTRRKNMWPYDTIKWLRFEPDNFRFDFQVGRSIKAVNSSKFCSGRLLNIRNDVRRIIKENFQCSEGAPKESCSQTELSGAILATLQSECPEILKDSTVLNFKATLWSSVEKEGVALERDAFSDIMDAMEDRWRGSNLIIQGYPMLTQFSVGVVSVLAHLFDAVGFLRPHGQDFALIFRSYQNLELKVNRKLDELMTLMETLEKTETSVMTVTPLQDLIYGHPDFYACVIAVNSLCVQEQICDIINQLNPKKLQQ